MFLSSNLSLLRPTSSCILSCVRQHSSHEWLQRQFKDPYVKQARQLRYRARSAFKLLQIHEKYRIFKPGHVVVDLGASPGSWTQVAVDEVNADVNSAKKSSSDTDEAPQLMFRHSDRSETPYTPPQALPASVMLHRKDAPKPTGIVIGVDLLHINPLPGAKFLCEKDFTNEKTKLFIKKLLDGKGVDVLLSDMAPNASGIASMDHDRIVKLCQTAYQFGQEVLKENGTFLCKLWQGRDTNQFRDELKKHFKMVTFVKPDASRDDSSEIYLLSMGYRKEGIEKK